MQFVRNGPDIPERLLQAHEEGKVVFFCGAGISYPAGLPGFGGLVEKLYQRLGASPTPVESVAKKSGLYDTAIGLLEGRIVGGRAAVRRHIATTLTPNYSLPRATETHAALINLSTSRKGQVRLVTTNFDRIFEAVIADKTLHLPTFEAPLLPVPKNRWSGLVYLHGLLTEAPIEDDLNRLVVSSGDFGLAYLTERWAARFVSELFRAYTVCFVGYSLNDPVLRYMMDALAADRLMGEAPAEAFAFGSHSKGRESIAEQEWGAKNVTPILYREYRKHYYLHETIRVWAASYRDGVRGKEAIVARYATIRPTKSTNQDDFVRRMLWALSDSTGLPAKRFADFDPVPSLDWLGPLTERQFGHQDLSRFGVQPDMEEDDELSFSLIARPSPYTHASWMTPVQHSFGRYGSWDRVMEQIARWLAKHVGDPKLLLWVAGRGGELHSVFKRFLEKEIETSPPAQPMQKLWRLVLGGRLRARSASADLYSWQRRFLSLGFSPTLRLSLRDALTPYVELRQPFRWPDDDNGDDQGVADHASKVSDLVRWEIVLAADNVHYVLKELRPRAEWQAILPELLTDATGLLRDAVDLMRELGGADHRHDGSYVQQPSISDHPQNTDLSDWTALIELVRDAWLATADIDPNAASAELGKWLAIEYPLFRRLAFFAAVQEPSLVSVDDAVDWLLADDHWWLWTVETQRERLRLLVSLSPRLTPEQGERLQVAILEGPPQDMFRDDIKRDDLRRIVDREIWLALAKLHTSGATLTREASARLKALTEAHPDWQIAADERDEFPYWTSSGDEWRTYRPTPKLRKELEAWLREYPSVDNLHETDNWVERCAKDFPRTTAALLSLSRRAFWPTDRWRQALQVWSTEEFTARSWRYVSPVLATVPDAELSALARPIAWWLEAVAKGPIQHDEVFFDLVARIIALYQDDVVELEDGAIGSAINHPVGLSTSAVLRWWFGQNLEDGQGLREEVVPLLNAICNPDAPGLHHGRIVLAGSTIALHRVDRDWTEQNLLGYFRWEVSEDNARTMWQSFLHSPRLYWPLLEALKEDFLAAAQRYDALGQAHARQYAAFLTYAALEPGGTFTDQDFRKAIAELPVSALAQIAETLFHALQGAGEQRTEFLRNRIAPFFRRIWPNSQDAKTPSVSEGFAKLCTSAGNAFPDALDMFKDWLQPISDVNYVTHLLHEAKLCEKFPADALTFLDLIVPANPQWLSNDLRSCLRAIQANAAEPQHDQRFQRLVTLLQQRGIDWP
jgi:hypothetical protein